MARGRWIWLVAVAALLGCGCSGILAEKVADNGQMERLRLDSGGKWSTYDQNPLKEDESSIMLKKELTF
jgi:hypothetical protein